MEKIVYQKVWNLDKIFWDRSNSIQFLDYVKRLESLISDFERCDKSFNDPVKTNEVTNLGKLVEYIGEIRVNLSQANSFITCLLAQNTNDQEAATLRGKVAQLESHFEKELSKVKIGLANIKQDIWESLVETKELEDYRFILYEWRENTAKHLSDEEQNLISDLKADGYHAWGHFYNALISSINVNEQVDGEEKNQRGFRFS